MEILGQPTVIAHRQLTGSVQPQTSTTERPVSVDVEQLPDINAETSISVIANQQVNSPQQNIANRPISIEDDMQGPIDMNELERRVGEVVEQCKESDVVSNKEILRLLQSKILQGRSLDIEREDVCPEGETSYIYVDRYNLLETALEEIAAIDNLFLTLCVQFYGEQAQDYGGPRREFFRLALREIKEKYFDHGLRELLKDEYEIVGTIMGLSILQNGKLPQFIPPDVISALFDVNVKLACIENLRTGLKKVGIFQICSQMPSMQDVFRFNPSSTLTIRKLNAFLSPQFSPTGSNRRRFEGAVYAVFCKYVREVAANTCVNAMTLPHAPITVQLPHDQKLWELYDEAFLNAYFGNM
ncbi:uncharacterized protein LOC114538969 [Dendronephthya gigantea]|uniref:uncharacterized protein LOC114538969 n=1 Tax=Dendronephthya gigantea TaxID=151771 RepID=UPI00106B64C4|nr:uncharacterized protein LOC114538969 [Dendronephthya gigantea]